MSNFIEKNFTKVQFKKYKILFSNSNIDFKIDNKDFKVNLDNLKQELKIDDIGFLKQIHSDIIIDYNGKVIEGDSIITNKKNIALGVFTADCVPILLYDNEKDVIAAVHSGWKGTYNNILGKTIDKMIQQYHCKAENIFAFIGPHIQQCCYEVSENLIDEFKNKDLFKNVSINNRKHLDLNICILIELKEKGIYSENIYNTKICTYCEKENIFHSFRRDKENSGRILSIIYF